MKHTKQYLHFDDDDNFSFKWYEPFYKSPFLEDLVWNDWVSDYIFPMNKWIKQNIVRKMKRAVFLLWTIVLVNTREGDYHKIT